MEAALLRRCSLGEPPCKPKLLGKYAIAFWCWESPSNFVSRSRQIQFSPLGQPCCIKLVPNWPGNFIAFTAPVSQAIGAAARGEMLLLAVGLEGCLAQQPSPSLLGWRSVREQGLALHSYSRCPCSLPRRGLPLL